MQEAFETFRTYLYLIVEHHLKKEKGEGETPDKREWETLVFPSLVIAGRELTSEEKIIYLLAVAPHLCPEALDLMFVQNPVIGRPYTEFGGRTGKGHTGFIPTGETAVFLLSGGDFGKREEYMHLLSKEHWFFREHILWLEQQERGEPFLSGGLAVSEELLAGLYGFRYEPEYTPEFPAKRIVTPLEWEDLVLPCYLQEDLEEVLFWLTHSREIRRQWQLDRIIKPGYRCLFYGPPGTGKTLAAMLLGKQLGKAVYRIDLSMVVSKYIGETEKNLAVLFDKAVHHQWILFFDEADSLFGQRTETHSSNDRHANQEVAYLLQRIEDFPGTVILATNLKEQIDEAFFRRFQSIFYFPVPDKMLRYQLWKQLLPAQWNVTEEVLQELSVYKLAGGSMINVIRQCAVRLFGRENFPLTSELMREMILKEQRKEGKLISDAR